MYGGQERGAIVSTAICAMGLQLVVLTFLSKSSIRFFIYHEIPSEKHLIDSRLIFLHGNELKHCHCSKSTP